MLSSYLFKKYMGLIQFSLSLVMAVLGCGDTHFIYLDTFNYFSSFRNLRVKCFQQCPRIFNTMSVIQSLGHSVAQSICHSVSRSLGHSVTRSLGHTVTRSLGHSVIWSFGHSITFDHFHHSYFCWSFSSDPQT